MTRTTRLKMLYFATLLGVVALAFAASALIGSSLVAFLVIAALLFVPGRVQAMAYRDLNLSRRLLAAGRPDEAADLAQRFVETIRRNPGRKKLLWLTGSFYTTDVEAMGLNNLGAAQMERGDLEAAAKTFEEALRVDPLYPIPYFNLAMLAGARGDRAEAVRYAVQAQRRGFRHVTEERVMKLGAALRPKEEKAEEAVSG